MSGKPRTFIMKRFWDNVDKTGDCWEWRGAKYDDRGYGLTRLFKKKHLAHRVAFLFAYGTVPEELCVLHVCDNPICCRPDHLFLGTRIDNNHDCLEKGRHSRTSRNRGESCGSSKLKEADVKMIRERYATETITQARLANEYGVNQSTITYILNGKSWRWLT
jgi:hypothetical protein